MARRNANLAGLAALGALGYKLANAGTKTSTGGSRTAAEPDALMELADDQYNPDVRYGSSADLGDELGTRRNLETGEYYNTAMSPKRASAGVSRPQSAKKPYSMASDTVDSNVKQYSGPKGRSYSAGDAQRMREYENERTKNKTSLRPAEEPDLSIPPAATSKYQPPSSTPANRGDYGMLDSIKNYYASPSSMEGVKRNISNTLNATTGLSAPGFVGRETAKQFGNRAAARRAEEGLSDAEVADVLRRRALNEADTTGGAVGYKKGGAVKAKAKKMVVTKMGGKVSSASKRADGIAMKGKTRGKLY